jgi:hypothetical protein
MEKIHSSCEGHLISMNFPLRNWEGYYAYSKVGEKIMPIFIGLMIYIGLVHDKFCLVLYGR